MKKTRKDKPIIFVQKCVPYGDEFLVAAGATEEEVYKWGRKHLRKKMIDWLKTDRRIWEIFKTSNGVFAWDNKIGVAFLLLRPYRNDWEYWDTLIHETAHIIQWESDKKLFADEYEARAYFQENIFREIRRALEDNKKAKNEN